MRSPRWRHTAVSQVQFGAAAVQYSRSSERFARAMCAFVRQRSGSIASPTAAQQPLGVRRPPATPAPMPAAVGSRTSRASRAPRTPPRGFRYLYPRSSAVVSVRSAGRRRKRGPQFKSTGNCLNGRGHRSPRLLLLGTTLALVTIHDLPNLGRCRNGRRHRSVRLLLVRATRARHHPRLTS